MTQPPHIRPCPLGDACPCQVGVYQPFPKPPPPAKTSPPADPGGLFAGLEPPAPSSKEEP